MLKIFFLLINIKFGAQILEVAYNMLLYLTESKMGKFKFLFTKKKLSGVVSVKSRAALCTLLSNLSCLLRDPLKDV